MDDVWRVPEGGSREDANDEATRRLVGALAGDDVTRFCDHASYEIQAGEVPATCTHGTPDRLSRCLVDGFTGG